MEQWLLVVIVLCAVLTAGAGFVIGERRRRGEVGQSGPQPVRSIGEAIRLAGQRRSRVLVLFLDEGPTSAEVGLALAEDPAIVKLLAHTPFVVVKSEGGDQDIAAALYTKYAGEPLPKLPAALQLDPDGQLIASAEIATKGPVQDWLVRWMDPRETPGPAPAP